MLLCQTLSYLPLSFFMSKLAITCISANIGVK